MKLLNYFGICGISQDQFIEKWNLLNEGSKFIEIDGTTLHYRDEGGGQRVLLLIHGIADSLLTWNKIVPELKNEYRVIRIDIPGFGLSSRLKSYEDIDSFWLSIINKLLDKLEIKHVTLIGNSLGGYISWNFALRYKESVESLYLIDPAGFPMKKAPFIVEASTNFFFRKFFVSFCPKFLFKFFFKSVFSNKKKLTKSIIDLFFDLTIIKEQRSSYMNIFQEIAKLKETYPENLKLISQKIKIIFGKDDKWISPKQVLLWEKELKQAETMLIPSCGHTPQLECSKLLAQDLKQFLSARV